MVETLALRYGEADAFADIPLGASAGGYRCGVSLARTGDMGLLPRVGAGLGWNDGPQVPETTLRQALRPDGARQALLAALGVPPGCVRVVRQVHSKRVIAVDGAAAGGEPRPEADGMVSAGGGALLTVTVADCLPIFLVDPEAGVYGLVHSGWKGTGIVREALRMMGSLGASAGRISAVVGPGIGACCYRVPRERYEGFRSEFGERAVALGTDGSTLIDLRGANIGLLEAAGIAGIRVISDCTSCSPHLGSFRRQGPREFTRMLAFIGPRASFKTGLPV